LLEFLWIHIVPRAFDFVHVVAVALVSLDLFVWVKEVGKNFVKYLYVGKLTSRIDLL
jgi:hypothetical protein